MAHNISARYEEQEHLFLPPLRTLGFNPQLNINDSLLVQSYIEAYDISYPEALQRIEDEVEELKQHLQNEGSYELNDIGTLALNEDGNYVFTPCEAGILTPALYGLSSVEMSRIGAIQPQQQPQPVAVVTPEEPSEEPTAKMVDIDTESTDTDAEYEEEEEADVVRIKYSWIRNAVAVAAILLAVFILALPNSKTDMMQRTISNLNNGLLFGMMSEDTNTSKITISKNVKTISRSEEREYSEGRFYRKICRRRHSTKTILHRPGQLRLRAQRQLIHRATPEARLRPGRDLRAQQHPSRHLRPLRL